MKKINSKTKRLLRNRSKLKKFNVDRYRITIFKSLKNISAQIIDDRANKTIVSASSTMESFTIEKLIFCDVVPALNESVPLASV